MAETMTQIALMPDRPSAPCECSDCSWKGPASMTVMISDIQERVSPGEIVPVGECPKCGCLAHYQDEKAPSWSAQRKLYEANQLLKAIAEYPANGNSDPDVMAAALDAIREAAQARKPLKVPEPAA